MTGGRLKPCSVPGTELGRLLSAGARTAQSMILQDRGQKWMTGERENKLQNHGVMQKPPKIAGGQGKEKISKELVVKRKPARTGEEKGTGLKNLAVTQKQPRSTRRSKPRDPVEKLTLVMQGKQEIGSKEPRKLVRKKMNDLLGKKEDGESGLRALAVKQTDRQLGKQLSGRRGPQRNGSSSKQRKQNVARPERLLLQ